jgi:antitoxin (DNA-binding transcriptional repressor) of toxin-antitoxin stability system
VKTITIRDLRQRWPEAEAALNLEGEVLITRDSVPVAKLVRVPPETARRPRWDIRAHARWQARVSAGHVADSGDTLAESRADRSLRSRSS